MNHLFRRRFNVYAMQDRRKGNRNTRKEDIARKTALCFHSILAGVSRSSHAILQISRGLPTIGIRRRVQESEVDDLFASMIVPLKRCCILQLVAYITAGSDENLRKSSSRNLSGGHKRDTMILAPRRTLFFSPLFPSFGMHAFVVVGECEKYSNWDTHCREREPSICSAAGARAKPTCLPSFLPFFLFTFFNIVHFAILRIYLKVVAHPNAANAVAFERSDE